MSPATSGEKLHQLNTMVLTDSISGGLYQFPIYPFTETPDNQASVLLRCEELFKFTRRNNSTFPILLIDNQTGSEPGYPGAPAWKKSLNKLGVAESDIMLIPLTETPFHTLSEAFTTVRFVQQKQWRKLVIVAPPFHLLRCFLSVVTAIQTLKVDLKVYCQVGITQPWYEYAVHSQGKTRGKRKNLIVGEIRRIVKYRRKNNQSAPLCSTDAALEYLEWRDTQP